MAEITVKPSPALGMCKSVMRTSKLAVEMHFRASVTPPTATTSNPLELSDSLIMSSTTSSSSTKRTLWIVCPSIEAIRHPSRSTSTLTLDLGPISGLVNSDQVAYKLSRAPIFGNRFHHRTVVMGIRGGCRKFGTLAKISAAMKSDAWVQFRPEDRRFKEMTDPHLL